MTRIERPYVDYITLSEMRPFETRLRPMTIIDGAVFRMAAYAGHNQQRALIIANRAKAAEKSDQERMALHDSFSRKHPATGNSYHQAARVELRAYLAGA